MLVKLVLLKLAFFFAYLFLCKYDSEQVQDKLEQDKWTRLAGYISNDNGALL